jgi:hypothetical protein
VLGLHVDAEWREATVIGRAQSFQLEARK